MFENYRATKRDFEAIGEGIEIVWQKEMNFVFKNKNLIKNVVVISYDSKFLYLWTKLKFSKLKIIPCSVKEYYTYEIPHKVKIKDEWQLGWRASLLIKQFAKLLPKRLQQSDFKIPKISGGLLKPFIELQKKKKIKDNPYITQESFLATIVHEFGHIYWNSHKLWWYSGKKENIFYLKMARRLYEKKEKIPKISLYFPVPISMGELFAFCAEYSASNFFWPNHKQNLDIFAKERIKELIKLEKRKDLEKEDSVLEPSRNAPDFTLVFGKIIFNQHATTWPNFLLKKRLSDQNLSITLEDLVAD